MHFGTDHASWECKNGRAFEVYPKGFEAAAPSPNLRRYPVVREVDFESAYALWQKVIYAYYACNLTRGSDKLAAVSGIARSLSAFGGPKNYSTGIWLNSIVPGLQWFCDRRQQPMQHDWSLKLNDGSNDASVRPSRYRALTWSWASVDGPVILPPYKQIRKSVVMIRVINVVVDHVTDDSYGEVKVAYIRIAGQLRTIKLPSKKQSSNLVWK